MNRTDHILIITKGILEDAKDLDALYDAKLREYNALK